MNPDHAGYANLANLRLLEELYDKWLKEPTSVDPSWQNFFDGMQFASKLPQVLPVRQESGDLRVYYLIQAYRTYGHLMTRCDCLASEPPPFPEELKLQHFGLSDADLNEEFPTSGFMAKERAPLKEILEKLKRIYCQTLGVEYMDLGSVEIEKWIQSELEQDHPPPMARNEQLDVLDQLNQAEGFETFVHTKYVGQKRFSLEGAETFIPVLHAMLDEGAMSGVSDVVLGMAHRGRLNVLANILGKSYSYIFEEFEDHYTPDLSESTGDVKYHMGFAGTYHSKSGKKIQVILSANPSHLESVDPVVEGGARATQEHKKPKGNQNEVVPILVHGDAAVAGQGVVYETLSLGRLKGYGTHGTLHVVINNQIGFTTLPQDSRSTKYCTDIAKAFGAPVFHVNAEDPEACVKAARMAAKLRQRFGCDVFIDLMGYRKYGHNESDEPTFTQPLEYQQIRSKHSIRSLYRDRLIQDGVLSKEDAEAREKKFKDELNSVLESVKSTQSAPEKLSPPKGGRHLEEMLAPVETKVSLEELQSGGAKITTAPEGFNLHPKVKRLLGERAKMVKEGPIDWGMGELLAYATLAAAGTHIRLSGQDVRRGTFSHRHALFVDQLTSSHYFPLSHLADSQGACDFFNSPLSEFAVLGFEFGYSLMYPGSLVLWEGQFGDFANGAQIIIDQYFATAEMKWGHATNLTLLLPHGYEGMGPEHSSARIERFLQLAADENMTVANCTTPAQLFHLLRRQALRPLKKPLVLFTPKAILRSPFCVSPIEAFTEGRFHEILLDETPPEAPKRLLLCSGKIYYDLLQQREKRGGEDTIIRLEQLYPLHREALRSAIEGLPSLQEVLYVQEEHENMGAWHFLEPQLKELLGDRLPLRYVGRRRAASPAAGSHALHKLEQEALYNTLYPNRQES